MAYVKAEITSTLGKLLVGVVLHLNCSAHLSGGLQGQATQTVTQIHSTSEPIQQSLSTSKEHTFINFIVKKCDLSEKVLIKIIIL